MCVSCDGRHSSEDSTAQPGRVSRRALLGGVGAAAAGLVATAAPAFASPAAAPAPVAAQTTDFSQGMHVVLLGTAGGPPPHADRCGVSSALVVDGAVYLVDAGRSAVTQYKRAGLALKSLAGIFITHLHADHIADLYNFYLLGGNANPAVTDTLAGPTPVYGPGPAGALPPTFGGGTSPTVNPADPTPGLAALAEYSHNAYAYSSNLFMRDSRIRDIRTLMDVHEIAVPDVGAGLENTAPPMDPFVVLEDAHVRVTAVLVPHGPALPSFAYRFDTAHGSVTFSGDTTYSDNLLTLAHETDILVHEAINVQGWAGPDALKAHLIESHVEVQKVGEVAEAAAARRLVLSHIGDLATSPLPVTQWAKWARQGYSGKVDIGEDLAVYSIKK